MDTPEPSVTETQPQAPKIESRKRTLSERQLESLKLGREKRWKKLQDSQVPSATPIAPQEEPLQDFDPEGPLPDTPLLKRQNAEYHDMNSDSSGSDTEVVVVRRQLTKMEKKLNKHIDKRLKKIMDRLKQEAPPTPTQEEDNHEEEEQKIEEEPMDNGKDVLEDPDEPETQPFETHEDSYYRRPHLSTNSQFYYQAKEDPFMYV